MTAEQQNDNKNTTKKKKEYNVFRDSLVRYLGYANEVGESFRYQFPKLVIPSYVVSFGYCFADAATAGYQTYNATNSSSSSAATVITTFDTLLWQSLASVMIPGATINMIVRASRFAVARSPMILPAALVKWTPTAVGLASIPVIIHPIDHTVDCLLEVTTRKWLGIETGDCVFFQKK